MCDLTSRIKLCTCGDEKIKFKELDSYKKVRGGFERIPNKKNDEIPLIYIWQLFRHRGKDDEWMMLGSYRFPVDDIGNGLNADG